MDCPYLSTASLGHTSNRQHNLDSPCNYNACIVHSDGCECLLYQWHYCAQPTFEVEDTFCASLLEGMQDPEAKDWLKTCMREVKVLWSREESNSSHVAADLTRPPAGYESILVDEVEIAFVEDGPLGLKLKPDPLGAATILEVPPETPAARQGLKAGMVLRAIGKTSVSGQPYKKVLKVLKRASQKRPLVLRFGADAQ